MPDTPTHTALAPAALERAPEAPAPSKETRSPSPRLRPGVHPGVLLLLFSGGALGSAARHGLESWFPDTGGLPWTVCWINIGGAFCLGLLLGWPARDGRDSRLRRGARIGLGAGVLGGFTTYSSFAVRTDQMLLDGQILAGLAQAGATAIAGVVAAWLGVTLARLLARASSRRRAPRRQRGER